jgi:hypothetical protein
LREEHRLRVFENRLLRRIFGPMRDEVIGVEKTTYKYHSGDQIKKMRWVGCVACMGESRGAYRVVVGSSGERRPLGRLRHRWENNFKWPLEK